jgi:hypothetical protein
MHVYLQGKNVLPASVYEENFKVLKVDEKANCSQKEREGAAQEGA